MCHLLAQPFVESTSSVGNGKVPESAALMNQPVWPRNQPCMGEPDPHLVRNYHTTVAAHCSAAVPGRTTVTLTWNAPVEADDVSLSPRHGAITSSGWCHGKTGTMHAGPTRRPASTIVGGRRWPN